MTRDEWANARRHGHRTLPWLALVLIALVGVAGGGSSVAHADIRDIPEPDEADAEGVDELERWVPSVSAFGGIFSYRAQGRVESGPVLGPTAGNSPSPIRPPADGSDDVTSALVGGTVELMTPRIADAAWWPRFFAHVDLLAVFGFDRTLAGEGSPGDFELPPLGTGIFRLEEVLWEGQGSRTKAETQTFAVSAGAGITFTIDAFDRRFRIKPSVEYMREDLEIRGIVNRAITINRPAREESDFRFIELSDKKSKIYHGIGPGIELAMDAQRAGPVTLTVYASGQAYRFYGDRKVELEDENEFGERARWEFEKHKWGWGARVGLRFRWLPD